MGQKVNPISFRLSTNGSWLSSWYSNNRDYIKKLHQDINIRKFFSRKKLLGVISKIVIARLSETIILNIHTSNPELILSNKTSDIAKLKLQFKDLHSLNIEFKIVEIKKPESDPILIARSIAIQLERRMPFRKVLKRMINLAIKAGIKGIRINIKGRLGGSEIARTEWYKEGCIPLHTIRAPLAYGFCEAFTVYGTIGIKVWIHEPMLGNQEIQFNETTS